MWSGTARGSGIEVIPDPSYPIVHQAVSFTVREIGGLQLGDVTINFGDGMAETQKALIACQPPGVTEAQASTRTLFHTYSSPGTYRVDLQATVNPCAHSKNASARGALVVRAHAAFD